MRKFLLSILAMVCATAMAFAGEYTITFKDNGVGAGDNTAEFSQSKDITTFIAEGTDYLSSIKSTSKVYLGKDGHGLKFSSSKANGSLVLNLTESGAKKITKVVATASAWLSTTNKPDSKAAVAINGATAQAVTSDLADYTFNFTPTENSTTLSINATERIYVAKLVVTYEDDVPAVPSHTVTFQIEGEGNVELFDMSNESVTYENGGKVPDVVNLGARFIPADGWEFKAVYMKFNGMEIEQTRLIQNGSLRIGTQSIDLEFRVVFEKAAIPTHAITLIQNGEGTVTIKDADNNTYGSGDAIPASADLTLVFAPAEGWQLASAVLDGTEATVVDGTYHVGQLTDDQTLEVTFAEATVANMAIQIPNVSSRTAYRLEVDESAVLDRTSAEKLGDWPYLKKSFTMTGWYKIIGYSNGGNVLMGHQPRCHVNYNGAFVVNVSSQGKLGMGGKFKTESAEVEHSKNFSTEVTVPVGEWVNIAAAYDAEAQTIKVYYNGELAGTRELGATLTVFPDNPGVLTFGSTNANCYVDEAALFDGALTAEQVKQAMNGAASMSPLCFYTFNATNGTDGEYANEGSLEYPAKLIKVSGSADGNTVISAYSFVSVAATSVEGRVIEKVPETGTNRLVVNTVGEGTVTVTDQNGNEYDCAGADVPWEAIVKLTATPAAGWKLKSVEVGGEAAEAAEDGSYLNMELFLDCDVTVTFEENESNMIYMYQPKNNGGTLQVFRGETELHHQDYVPAGAVIRLVATPNEGFEFSKFKYNNSDVAAEKVTVDEAGVATYEITMPEWGIGLEAEFTETTTTPVEYCTFDESVKSTHADRYTEKITVKINDGDPVDYDGLQTSTRQKIYWDKTETVITAAAGDELTVTLGFHGSWMHSAVMVDYDKDGEFLFDVNETFVPSAQSEVVAFTGVSSDSGNHYDSNGTVLDANSRGDRATRPMTFTLPADLAPGDYRFRATVDWNKPIVRGCPLTTGDNPITTNGGIVADFTLRIEAIEPREVSVKSNDEALGTAAIVAPEASSSTITTDQPVMVKATKVDDDAYFVNWTDAEGNVMSEDLEYTYSGKEAIELTANFRQHYMLTIVDSEEGTTVKAGTEVVASGDYVDKGTRLTVICEVEGKILKSLMVNEVEKVEEYVGTGYTFTMNEATAIEVEYALPVYEVGQLAVEGEGTLVVAEGVTAEGAPSGATFAEGAELEKGSEPVVIATPAAHYKVESMIVDGFAVVTDGKPLEEDEYVSTYAEGLIVAYKAYVEGSLNASVKFVHDGSAIESIGADEAGDAEFFNLQGMRVARENLVPGIYIMRNAEGARKVSVK